MMALAFGDASPNPPSPQEAVSEPAPFPWDEAMALALGRLRWSPQSFWRATPRELCAALEDPRRPVTPADARDLAALMRAFPDGGTP
jgi:uncharacterized phage protein (TIGR02216 family)